MDAKKRSMPLGLAPVDAFFKSSIDVPYFWYVVLIPQPNLLRNVTRYRDSLSWQLPINIPIHWSLSPEQRHGEWPQLRHAGQHSQTCKGKGWKATSANHDWNMAWRTQCGGFTCSICLCERECFPHGKPQIKIKRTRPLTVSSKLHTKRLPRNLDGSFSQKAPYKKS